MEAMNKEIVIVWEEDDIGNSKRQRRDFNKRQSRGFEKRQRKDFNKRQRRGFDKRQRIDFEKTKKDITSDHSVINNDDKDTNHNIIPEISSDIQFKILSCLPLKSLFKFKCVSKEFCRLIPELVLEYYRRLAANLIPFTGFFVRRKGNEYRYTDHGYKPSFISTYTDAGVLPDSSLSFLKDDQLKDDVKIIDSCNGLLLCKIITKKEKLYVCNPLTMQKVFVPYPRNHRSTHYHKKFALIAQSTSTGFLRYKVLYIYDDMPTKYGDKRYSKLCVFSSESSEWEEFPYRLPALSQLIRKRTKSFVKGTLIWDCFDSGKYILVCYLNYKSSSSSSRCFELIESPSRVQYVRFLLNYNGKILFYTHAYESYQHQDGEFSAWSLCFDDNNKTEWKIESSLQFRNLAEDIWKYCFKQYPGRQLPPRNKWWRQMPRRELEIVGYNPSLKTMYVLMYGAMVSYELVKRRTKLVCGSLSGSLDPIAVFQYLHSLEPIEIGRTQTAISTTVDNDETEYDDGGGGDPILVEDDDVRFFI